MADDFANRASLHPNPMLLRTAIFGFVTVSNCIHGYRIRFLSGGDFALGA